jgi:hypothetical protein
MDDITPDPIADTLAHGPRHQPVPAAAGWLVDRHQPLAGPQSAVIARRR